MTPDPTNLREKTILAMNAALDTVVAEHQRYGHPLAIWREGKVVLVPPEQTAAAIRRRKEKEQSAKA